jgi:hypothetical protein
MTPLPRIVVRVGISVLAVIAAGCDGVTGTDGVAVLPTARTFSTDAFATFVVRNDTRETIHVDRCGSRVLAGLDRRKGLHWENEMAALCVLSIISTPLALAPGESVTDSVLVRSSGIYRVVVGYGRGNLRILYQARSGNFTVAD